MTSKVPQRSLVILLTFILFGELGFLSVASAALPPHPFDLYVHQVKNPFLVAANDYHIVFEGPPSEFTFDPASSSDVFTNPVEVSPHFPAWYRPQTILNFSGGVVGPGQTAEFSYGVRRQYPMEGEVVRSYWTLDGVDVRALAHAWIYPELEFAVLAPDLSAAGLRLPGDEDEVDPPGFVLPPDHRWGVLRVDSIVPLDLEDFVVSTTFLHSVFPENLNFANHVFNHTPGTTLHAMVSYLEVSEQLGLDQVSSQTGFSDPVYMVIPFTPVPEPSTLAMLALGGLSLVGYARRRRR